MNSFAESEPREFFPFHLGIASNVQPTGASSETSDSANAPANLNPNSVKETFGSSTEEGTSTPAQHFTLGSILPELVLSASEIIDGGSSRTSSVHERRGGLSPTPLTEKDPAYQRP